MQQMAQSNPQLAAAFSNPAAMQELMQAQLAAGAGGSLGTGAGFSMAQQMPDMATLMNQMQANAGQASGSNNNANNNSSNSGNGGGNAPDLNALFAALGGVGDVGGGAQGGNVAPPEERYASQLDALGEMGFVDRDQAVRALVRCNGNVNAAIEMLLSGNI